MGPTHNYRLRRILRWYFHSTWRPGLIFTVICACYATSFYLPAPFPPLVDKILLALLIVAAILQLTAILVNIHTRHWQCAFTNLVLAPVLMLILATVYFSALIAESFWGGANPPDSTFEVAVREPAVHFPDEIQWLSFDLQDKLLHVLDELYADNDRALPLEQERLNMREYERENLLDLLAGDPGWRVYFRDGRYFARSRWFIDGGLSFVFRMSNLNPEHDDETSADHAASSALSVVMAFDEDGRESDDPNSTAGMLADVYDHSGRAIAWTTRVLDLGQGVAAEILEAGSCSHRVMTKSAILALREHLESARDRQALLGGIGHFAIFESSSPRQYEAVIFFNPGEPGLLHIKARKAVEGIELSADELFRSTNERSGWSDDPNDLFLSHSSFSIRETFRGMPYAADFEVWFQPDRGDERRVLLKTYMIQGRN